MNTFYFQSRVNTRTIVAIRRYSCGHYVVNCWIKGRKMSSSNIRVPVALFAELQATGKLLSVRIAA